MSMQDIRVHAEEAGERIDTFLAKKIGITRSQIQKRIEEGDVLINGRAVNQNYRLKAGDSVSVTLAVRNEKGLVPQEIPLEILYQDSFLVVVNKPAGMVVYPAAGHAEGTLMNALAYHCDKHAAVGGPLRPGVVHRLDKDTSGVMVVALDDESYYHLAEQFRQRTINRRYLALIYGDLREETGEISLIIGRSESDRKKMSTRVRRGKEAVTRWRVARRFRYATFIEAQLGTGRTHQIRVHFASIGHPVLGDKIYGKKVEVKVKGRGTTKITFPRQMLHAEMLGFIHPASGDYREFSSPLPEDMQQKIKELEEAAGFEDSRVQGFKGIF